MVPNISHNVGNQHALIILARGDATSLIGRLLQLVLVIAGLFASRLAAAKWLQPFPEGLDVLHLFFGMALAHFLFETLRGTRGPVNRFLFCGVVVCGVLFVSGMAEWIQPLIRQKRDLWDVVVAMAGAVTFCLFRIVGTDAPPSLVRRSILRMACIASASVGLWRPLVEIADGGLRRYQFPVLASFETPLELRRWTPRGCQIRRIRNTERHGYVLRVTAHEGIAYPGISSHKIPSDWTGYERLHFLAASEPPLVLTLRIDDEVGATYENRFQNSYLLDGDWHEFNVNLTQDLKTPRGRPLELRQITAVSFFIEQVMTGSVAFYLDEVRLRP